MNPFLIIILSLKTSSFSGKLLTNTFNFKKGQLTPKGLFQSYSLGQFLKNYYSRFLNPSFDFERVFARSVDLDRSLMSSSTFLSGKLKQLFNQKF